MQDVVKGRGTLNGGNLSAVMARLNMRRPMLVCSARMQADFAARTGMKLPLLTLNSILGSL